MPLPPFKLDVPYLAFTTRRAYIRFGRFFQNPKLPPYGRRDRLRSPRFGPSLVIIVFAIVISGVVLVLLGTMLSSQVTWQPDFQGSGPGNVTIPAGGAYAYGGFGGRGPIPPTRVIAYWSTNNWAGDLKFEVIDSPHPGGLVGILNSSALEGSQILTTYQSGIGGFADVTFSTSSTGNYFETPVLIDSGPPVQLKSFGVTQE